MKCFLKLLSIVLLSIPVTLKSQVDIKWGKEFNNNRFKKLELEKVIQETNDFFWVLVYLKDRKKDESNYGVMKVSKKTSNVESLTSIKYFRVRKSEYDFVDVVGFNGSMYVLKSRYKTVSKFTTKERRSQGFFSGNKAMDRMGRPDKEDFTILYAQKLDSRGAVTSEFVELDTAFSLYDGSNAGRYSSPSSFNVVSSSDRTKLAVAIENRIPERNWPGHPIKIYGANWKCIKNTKKGLYGRSRVLKPRRLLKDGSMRLDIASFNFSKGNIDKGFYEFVFNWKKDSADLVKFSNSKLFLSGMLKYANESSNQLLSFGFYSKQELTGVDGIHFGSFDLNTGKRGNKKSEFSSEFLNLLKKNIQRWDETSNSISKKKMAKKVEKRLQNYKVKKVISLENGEFVVLAEYDLTLRLISHSYNQRLGGGMGWDLADAGDEYYRNDIIYLKCTKDGDLITFKSIPKFMHAKTKNGFGSSFCSFEKNGSVYLLYNEHADNISLEANNKAIESLTKPQKGVLVCSYVNATGEVKKIKLIDNKMEGLVVDPFSFNNLRFKKGSRVILARTKKGLKWGRVQIK